MAYAIDFLPRARRELAKLDKSIGERIATAIDALADNPRPHGCKKLTGDVAWRIRVGDWRILYEIHDDRLLVLVLRIAHRREVYR